MLTALLAFAAFIFDQPVAPDYVLNAHAYARPGATPSLVIHRDDRFRIDQTRSNGDTASDYLAPGQRHQFVVVRASDGSPRQLYVGQDQTPRPMVDSESVWTPVSETRTLAGEVCRLYRRDVPAGVFSPRCITDDGIDLIVLAERTLQASMVQRRPVPARDVTPPFELLSLAPWIPAAALIDRPERDSTNDYLAEFGPDSSIRTIRRSGSWLSETDGFARTTLTNDELGISISYAGSPRDGLSIHRFEPGRRYGNFDFGPSVHRGQRELKVLGEQCSWFSRSSSPDSSTLECRTADGAVIAKAASGGPRLQGVPSDTPAALAHSFKRERVPLSEVLPPPAVFSRERYGFADAPRP